MTQTKNTNYDTIIFDLDGTLLNTLEDLTDSVNYVMKHYGYPEHSIEDVRRFVGNGIRNLMMKATPSGEDNVDFEEGFQLFKSHYMKHCMEKTAPYEGVMEFLQECKKRNIKMAIVSNKNQKAVEELTNKYFDDFIEVSVGDDECRRRKPYPDAVDTALQELGSEKAHTLYVGDSDVDAKTAENSDLDCVLVSWGFRPKELLKELKSVAVIDKVEEMMSFIS